MCFKDVWWRTEPFTGSTWTRHVTTPSQPFPPKWPMPSVNLALRRSPVASDNPWTVLASTRLYENAYSSLIEHRVRDAAGQESTYAVTHFRKIGVRVLPIDRELARDF